jgi:predicted DNA-binding transcriptional regulator YafY
MRADRLLSLLMLLQTRGRMTAKHLAGELEVSERTIYRDIDALSIAGVPVYAERGPGGGCALLDSYRTSLTGLNEDEVRALFMLSIPAPLSDLGVGEELRAALLKLSAALPAGQHNGERARQRIHLDSVWWFQAEESSPHLQVIHQAVWQDRRIRLTYRLPFDTQVERLVDPYGLVAKTSVWYLVCGRDDHIRVQRVSDVVDVQLTGETFERPPGFDLARFWGEWCRSYEDNRPCYPVTARVSPEFVSALPQYFGRRLPDLTQVEPPDDAGWITMILPFETFWDARRAVLSFGRAVEVLEPVALRLSVIDLAQQIVAFYGDEG